MKEHVPHGIRNDRRDHMGSPSDHFPRVSSTRTQLIVRYSRLQAVGGFLLASTLFLPATTSFGSPFNVIAGVIPDFSSLVFHIQSMIEYPLNLFYLAAFFILFGGYIFGLFVFLNRLGSGQDSPLKKVTSLALSLLTGAIFISSLSIHLCFYLNDVFDIIQLAWIILSVSFCSYWFLCICSGKAGVFSLRLFSSFLMASWFLLLIWYSHDDTLWGLWISVCACLFITVGTFMEAKTITRKSYRTTLHELLFIKFNPTYKKGENCLNCGYLLFGLPSNRCPECGRPFDRTALTEIVSHHFDGKACG